MPPGLALLPLRLFLGATFVYAGVYKLSDAGFLHPGADTYIGDQLRGFASGTPGGPLIEALALPHPALAGVGVAVGEIAIGLLAVAGRFTRASAIAGFALSVLLFLTASWHTRPYFLGSDIVFAFAWLPFVLTGAEGQPALDNHPRVVPKGPGVTRRTAIMQGLGAVAAAAGAVTGLALLFRGALPAPARARAHSAGDALADAASLAPGHAMRFTDPADGGPALLIRADDGGLKAFTATCTHAGCEVAFKRGEIRCPCHGARYDPETGAPTRGPARTPLTPIRVVERGGKIVAG
jgi:thiosulfate dehydrogenase [quinone] large subunit